MSFLLDTNIFNHLAEGKISIDDLPTDFPILITYLQRDEIAKCPDPLKRDVLMSWLKVLPDLEAPLESKVLGIARLGHTRIGDGEIYKKILNILVKGRRRKNHSNEYDALIGEVAVKNQFVLMTNDSELAAAVKSVGGLVRSISATEDKSK